MVFKIRSCFLEVTYYIVKLKEISCMVMLSVIAFVFSNVLNYNSQRDVFAAAGCLIQANTSEPVLS